MHCFILLLLGVMVEVDAGLAPAVGEAADLAPEAHALHAAGARRGAGAASQHLAARALLLIAAGDPISCQISTCPVRFSKSIMVNTALFFRPEPKPPLLATFRTVNKLISV